MRHRVKPGMKVVYEVSQNQFIEGEIVYFYNGFVHVDFYKVPGDPKSIWSITEKFDKFTRFQNYNGTYYLEYLSSW